jgi:hypothetical protein
MLRKIRRRRVEVFNQAGPIRRAENRFEAFRATGLAGESAEMKFFKPLNFL